MDVAYSSDGRRDYPGVVRWQYGGVRINSMGLLVPGGFAGVTALPAASSDKHSLVLINNKMTEPNMATVRALARKYNIEGPILPSTQKDKKLMIMTPGGHWVHFGDSRYADFTTHGDLRRRLSYCARAGGIRDASGELTGNDPESANFYAMRLLWDCTP